VMGAEQPLTVDALMNELRDPPDILYLVCHGALKTERRADQEVHLPQLFLESSERKVQRIDGRELAERIGELRQQPRLIVLASCESAGTPAAANPGRPDVLVSLAPLLAAAGVPAIVAMRGRITMATIAEAMPVFFRELAKDGQLDRAMAVARGHVRQRTDAWMLALFTRLKEGRIWYVPGFHGQEQGFKQWESICSFVQSGKAVPIIGPDLASHIIGSPQELAQKLAQKYVVPLSEHERTDLAKVTQHIAIKDSPQAARNAVKNSILIRIAEKAKDIVGDKAPVGDNVKESLAIISEAQSRDPNDPFFRLAKLNVGVYVSATIIPFMEHFLKRQKKAPIPLVTDWKNERRTDLDFHADPHPDKPYVYYPFGNISREDSWVLTEDNYFDYLINMSTHNMMPDVIAKAVTSRCLLFMGFGLDDWKLRVLLRIILSKQGSSQLDQFNHVGVQLQPEDYSVADIERFQDYLEKYFGDKKIRIGIYWGSGVEFLRDLAFQLERMPAQPDIRPIVPADWD